jgi:putative sterol carrier protein
MTSQTRPDEGIFILNPVRAGSTMLRHLVDGHRDICSPTEPMTGRLADRLSVTIRKAVGQTIPEENRRDQVRRQVRRHVDDIMEQAASARGKKYWCDKSPDNVRFLDTIYALYPDARYVCLYRNCMDVVKSVLKIARREGILFEAIKRYVRKEQNANVVEAVIDYWTTYIEELVTFERRYPDQTLRVKYENLVFEPRETLRELFTFLGVDWYESLVTDGLRDSTEDEDRGKVTRTDAIRTDAVGGGSDVSIRRIRDSHRERMNTALRTLDYPTVDDDFNLIPSPYVPDEHRDDAAPASAGDGSASSEDRGSLDGEIAPDSAGPAASADEIEHLLRRRLTGNPDVQRLNVTVKLVVDDLAHGVWTVDLGNGEVRRGAGTSTDCTIALDSATLIEIAEGTIRAVQAQENGRLRARGDEEVVVQLGQIL